jgi:hypothetical protein
MNADPFYRSCCLKDETCQGRIERHHNLIYAGSRVDDYWSILPVCGHHHSLADTKKVREALDWVMIKRMLLSDMEKYPRVNWRQKAIYLQTKFEGI